RFRGFGRRIFQGFGEQPAEHPGGVQGQRQGTGVGAEAGGQHHQRRPDQLGNGAQGVEQQARRLFRDESPAAGRRQRQQQAGERRQQGTDGRHGQGLQGAVTEFLE